MTRLVISFLAVLAVFPVAFARANDQLVFENEVLPIFRQYCFACHGNSAPQVGLDLRTAKRAMRGSQNGIVIVPGSPQKSLLWKKVSTREMPLAQFNLKLSDAEIETVRRWIESGAHSEPVMLPADVERQFERYEKNIRPLLQERCVACHGGDDAEAELDLRSLASLVRGSRTGPVVIEGAAEKSILIRKVTSHAMPPAGEGQPLTDSEIQTIRSWIDRGRFVDFVDVEPRRPQNAASDRVTAADRRFWAFQKPAAVPLPNVQATDRIRSPVDRFILSRLEVSSLTFSADAPKRTLLRRAYFGLLGIPPTAEQTRAFLADCRADAYELLIDRLLASPHYGERWGRHWLDVVGYVDTSDGDQNPLQAKPFDGYWRYRDYVINATNRDMPWRQFLKEQLAGDELVDWRTAERYTPETLELLTATGYLRNVLDVTDSEITNLPAGRYEALFKLMERVASSTLAMTLQCARCHSHKFDPISQTDYYRLLSIFTPAYNPVNWLQPKRRHLFNVSRSEKAEIDRLSVAVREARQRRDALRKGYRDRLESEKTGALPKGVRVDLKAALAAPASKRSTAQQELVSKYGKRIMVSEAEVAAAFSDTDQQTLATLQLQIKNIASQLSGRDIEVIQALWDVGSPPQMRVLQRGDVKFAGPVVEPGFLTVLSSPNRSPAVPSPRAVGNTTGLRLAFAEWLTDPAHPLTARVIMNRVWHHHFGVGIVDTPGNFGATGSRPTHPELLDWLAVEFMQGDWSLKHIHKLLMTSTVYRQTSKTDSRGHQGRSLDAENRLLGRMNLRRLDAEALRDAVLSVSGQANTVMGGPPVTLAVSGNGLQTVARNSGAARARRSIYLLSRRSNPVTFLRLFDYPIIDVNCVQRASSATPLQALAMINSEFLTAAASELAQRARGSGTGSLSLQQQIAAVYWHAFSRPATPLEIQRGSGHVRQLQGIYENSGTDSATALRHSFADFVHMLLCTHEFLYVD